MHGVMCPPYLNCLKQDANSCIEATLVTAGCNFFDREVCQVFCVHVRIEWV